MDGYGLRLPMGYPSTEEKSNGHMGLDYSVQAGYGFFVADGYVWDLPTLLGRPGYEFDGFPEGDLLKDLGYSGIEIRENPSNTDPAGWAICAAVSSRSVSPKYETGIWNLGPESIPDEAMASLIVARDTLFPADQGPQPRIGWFLMAGIW